MRKILNLTQHVATPEQKAQGVVDLDEDRRKILTNLLIFEEIPSLYELKERAFLIANLCYGEAPDYYLPHEEEGGALLYNYAMIGGAPFFMSTLEKELLRRGITPLYAFSKRESIEELQPDGSVWKTQVFRHVGFVEVSQ